MPTIGRAPTAQTKHTFTVTQHTHDHFLISSSTKCIIATNLGLVEFAILHSSKRIHHPSDDYFILRVVHHITPSPSSPPVPFELLHPFFVSLVVAWSICVRMVPIIEEIQTSFTKRSQMPAISSFPARTPHRTMCSSRLPFVHAPATHPNQLALP